MVQNSQPAAATQYRGQILLRFVHQAQITQGVMGWGITFRESKQIDRLTKPAAYLNFLEAQTL